ncbi:MAG: molybdate ABC transporter substrate-binding protein [Deltaproteobacteria bacterium]|nr:molybdate ABC transporter substrate-binding protein [Deltaproteobacteria bacterium]
MTTTARLLTALLLAWTSVATSSVRAHAADPSPRPRTREVVVFAAASLTASFRAAATAFEAAHPDTKVTLNFAGSPTLVQQIREGAPADVFAAADEANMRKLVDAGAVAGAPRVFARNVLQIAVAKGNLHRIAGLADLVRPGLVVVLCGETVPCGKYALEAFGKAALAPPPGSRETDVKAVVTKVALGEADAGIVYATDVRAAADKITGVDLAPAHAVGAEYPIAILREATHAETARAFVAFVLSGPGTTILGAHGFLPP